MPIDGQTGEKGHAREASALEVTREQQQQTAERIRFPIIGWQIDNRSLTVQSTGYVLIEDYGHFRGAYKT